MNELPPPDFESLATPVGLRLNALCERFEQSWQRGERPAIEAALDQETDLTARLVLLRELIQLDIYYRRCAGDTPHVDNYLPRFPETGEDWLAQAVRGSLAPVGALSTPPRARGS